MIIMIFKKALARFFVPILSLSVVPLGFNGGISANAAVAAQWPLDSDYSEVTTYFDPNRNTGNIYAGHNAIDIPADYNANIYAPIGGVCVSAGWMDDYGILIILRHEALNVYTFYAHCSYANVSPGQTVSAGEVIGHVGNTGNSHGNHLHFGICDTLTGGWPDIMYYDPLTYFAYETEQPEDNCFCTEDYAGTYVTQNIETYLNVRSGHGSDFPSVGRLYPDSEFTVTKADGNWAHIESDGVSGYCSMKYIKRKDDIGSNMTISGELVPNGEIVQGTAFEVGGVITSNLPITRFTGGIYKADGAIPVYVHETSPNALKYDLSGEFDSKMLFNKLEPDTYVYKVEAEDSSGKVYPLIGKSFMVTSKAAAAPSFSGDLNGDGSITVADGILLQRHILGMVNLSDEQLKAADLTGDGVTDVFDMIMIRKILVS
ncbi:MAG: peptidoglycan DD-metalloendopeptidase family protein [Ruminococcus sp.]|nr:peptidoglycan DD-metalloendopeptidase family protein [Ruminococcus sp.]